MKLKALLASIIIFIITTIAAFYVGKTSNSIATIDNLATSLNDLRLDVQHLEQELVKKTGIKIRDKDRSISTTAQAFEKAANLLKQGDLATAGLYFSHAISQESGNWKQIQRYQQSVWNYCRHLIDEGNHEIAMNVLADMKTFIRTRSIYVPIQDIEKLQQILANISEFRQSIIDKLTQKNQLETTQFVKTLLTKSNKLLAKNPSQSNKINSQIFLLNENLFALRSFDGSVTKQNPKINQQIAQLETKIATFEQKLANIQENQTVSILVKQANQFIDKAKKEPENSDFILYYLTSAEAIIRQLVLVAPNIGTIKKQIAQLSQQLEQAKQEIANHQSEIIWNEINQAHKEVGIDKIDKHTKAQEAIEKLTQFRQIIAEKSNNLSSMEVLERVQTLMQNVNTNITNWQTKQIRRYEQWTIKKITTFYNRYYSELGIGTDEQIVYSGIIRNLGDIDIRYLSAPAQTAYNEAFQKFYAELNDEQKIPLSAKMTLMAKKPLSDF